MAQVGIREFDAKNMFARANSISYHAYLIESESDIQLFLQKEGMNSTRWVIKPDQLFGKRGKYGLIGANLDTKGIVDWWNNHQKTRVNIGSCVGELHTFLIEPFIKHNHEYYLALQSEREYDVLYFSQKGGIEIEENWDSVVRVDIPLLLKGENVISLIQDALNISDDRIIRFITHVYSFFREYGLCSLEMNPFVIEENGDIIPLDMVAFVDDSEAFRQKQHWGSLTFPHPFGSQKTDAEKYIEKLDNETGASLKFRILNPQGRIWLLTSGGGASVIIADTLADLGFADEIANYGECSGNPDRENTKAYTQTLLSSLLSQKNSLKKYLIIAGAIANFTHIDKTFAGIIDVFRERADDMRKQNVHILVRRGGIHDKEGLMLMKQSCDELSLPCEISDGNVYMTDILKKVQL